MADPDLKAKAVKFVQSLPHYEPFSPAKLQRELRCGYRDVIAVIEQMTADGTVALCPWMYLRADKPPEPPIMEKLRNLNREHEVPRG